MSESDRKKDTNGNLSISDAIASASQQSANHSQTNAEDIENNATLIYQIQNVLAQQNFKKATSLAFSIQNQEVRQDLLSHIRDLQRLDVSDPAEGIVKNLVKGLLLFSFLTMFLIAAAIIAETFGIQTQWDKGAQLLVEVIQIALFPVTLLVLGFYFGRGAAPVELLSHIVDKLVTRSGK